MLVLGTVQIISYITALGLAAIIPGPGMTALVARSVSGGAVTGFIMLAGLILGDLIYLSVAIFGLAIIAHTYTSIFTLINRAASLCLCVLALQFWSHQPHAINIDQKATRRELASAWFSGLTITLGNPKTIAFYLAILPPVISLDNVSLQIWGGNIGATHHIRPSNRRCGIYSHGTQNTQLPHQCKSATTPFPGCWFNYDAGCGGNGGKDPLGYCASNVLDKFQTGGC